MKRELREHIYISEISIDMNRECARFARSINFFSDVQTRVPGGDTKRDALCLANTFCPVFLVHVVHQEK